MTRFQIVISVAIYFIAAFTVCAENPSLRVTLLGTGSPSPIIERFGPSILVEAGAHKFLFDAGRGALQRLTQLKVRWQDIEVLFITHLHSDHVVGLPDLWLTGWLVGDRRNTPLRVIGPEGTKGMMLHLKKAFDFDIQIRQLDDKTSPEGIAVLAEEIHQGVVFERDGVKVTAFEVDHAPIKPAFGYRIDYGGHAVVLSGDTRPSENLVRHARGADLLVHEVIVPETLDAAGYSRERAAAIIRHHTTPEQAGMLFSRIKPRMAVYSHIVRPSASSKDLINRTRKTYSGSFEVGEDLMRIDVGKTILIHRQGSQ